HSAWLRAPSPPWRPNAPLLFARSGFAFPPPLSVQDYRLRVPRPEREASPATPCVLVVEGLPRIPGPPVARAGAHIYACDSTRATEKCSGARVQVACDRPGRASGSERPRRDPVASDAATPDHTERLSSLPSPRWLRVPGNCQRAVRANRPWAV